MALVRADVGYLRSYDTKDPIFGSKLVQRFKVDFKVYFITYSSVLLVYLSLDFSPLTTNADKSTQDLRIISVSREVLLRG